MNVCAQTPNSTPETQSRTNPPPTDDEVRRVALVEALERAQREVIAGRAYVDNLEAQLNTKTSIIAAQERRQTLSDQAIALLKKQAELLRAAIDEQTKIIEIDKKEIVFLRSELDKTNKKLKRSRAVNKYLIAGIVGILFALFAK